MYFQIEKCRFLHYSKTLDRPFDTISINKFLGFINGTDLATETFWPFVLVLSDCNTTLPALSCCSSFPQVMQLQRYMNELGDVKLIRHKRKLCLIASVPFSNLWRTCRARATHVVQPWSKIYN